KQRVWVSDAGRVWVGEDAPEGDISFEPGLDYSRGGDWIQADPQGRVGELSQNDLLGLREGGSAGTGPEHWSPAQGGPFGTGYGGGEGGTELMAASPDAMARAAQPDQLLSGEGDRTGWPDSPDGQVPAVTAREIPEAGFLRVSAERPQPDPAGVMRQVDLLDR